MGERLEIRRIAARRVLNSHCHWTLEFEVELADGRGGRGAAPKGETPSIYEGSAAGAAAPQVLDEARALLVGRALDEESLDELLAGRQASWGRSAVYALSVACFEAVAGSRGTVASGGVTEWQGGSARGSGHDGSDANEPEGGHRDPPAILFNLLNGGLHAYTNPITCDFTEFLLVPKARDTPAAIEAYVRLLETAPARLAAFPTRLVGGNRVADLGDDPNEAACELIRDMLDASSLGSTFGVMIDASAGDWVDGNRYLLPVSGARLESAALVDYWLGLIERFGFAALEDPLAEGDAAGWHDLHAARPASTMILGDNYTSSDVDHLPERALNVDGVLLKPDQAGTATRARRFARTARSLGLQVVASHRSIETDGTFLVHLALDVGADAIKIGPFSDLTSVVRTNELLRLASA